MLILTAYIVNKISVVSDEFCVRDELLKSVKTTGTAHIIAHILYVIFYFGFGDPQSALLIELFFTTIVDLFVIYYACNWTRKKFMFRQKVRLMHQMKIENGKRSSFSSFLTKRVQFQDVCNVCVPFPRHRIYNCTIIIDSE